MSEARAAIIPKTNVAVAGVPVTFHISESHLENKKFNVFYIKVLQTLYSCMHMSSEFITKELIKRDDENRLLFYI